LHQGFSHEASQKAIPFASTSISETFVSTLCKGSANFLEPKSSREHSARHIAQNVAQVGCPQVEKPGKNKTVKKMMMMNKRI
jgi:hypothetical protein